MTPKGDSSQEDHSIHTADGQLANPWGFSAWQTVGLIVLGLWSSFFTSAVALGGYRALSGRSELSTVESLVAGGIGLWIGMACILGWVLKQQGGTLRTAFGLEAKLPQDAVVGIGLGIAAQLVLLPLIYLPLRFLDREAFDSIADPATALSIGHGIAGMVTVYVFAAILAPLMEELFFRGFAFRAIAERIGPKWAIGLTTILFGLIHFQQVQTVGLLVVGLLFAYLRWTSGRLGPSIFAHCAFNGTALMILFLS